MFVLETRFGSACAQLKGGKFSRAFLNSPKFCSSLPITPLIKHQHHLAHQKQQQQQQSPPVSDLFTI